MGSKDPSDISMILPRRLLIKPADQIHGGVSNKRHTECASINSLTKDWCVRRERKAYYYYRITLIQKSNIRFWSITNMHAEEYCKMMRRRLHAACDWPETNVAFYIIMVCLVCAFGHQWYNAQDFIFSNPHEVTNYSLLCELKYFFYFIVFVKIPLDCKQ